jgi:hypothetical protein
MPDFEKIACPPVPHYGLAVIRQLNEDLLSHDYTCEGMPALRPMLRDAR